MYDGVHYLGVQYLCTQCLLKIQVRMDRTQSLPGVSGALGPSGDVLYFTFKSSKVHFV